MDSEYKEESSNRKKIGVILLILIIFSFLALAALKSNFLQNNLKKSETEVVSLPEGFPEMPSYPMSKLINSSKEIVGESNSYVATWTTSDTVPNVVSWYIDKLESTGWLIDVAPADLTAQDIQYLVVKKDDLILQLSVIQKEAGKIEITAEFPANYGSEADFEPEEEE